MACSARVAAPPRGDEAFWLQVDVSNVGAGAVERRIDDNKFEYLETDALAVMSTWVRLRRLCILILTCSGYRYYSCTIWMFDT